jgi:hypothetical protein
MLVCDKRLHQGVHRGDSAVREQLRDDGIRKRITLGSQGLKNFCCPGTDWRTAGGHSRHYIAQMGCRSRSAGGLAAGVFSFSDRVP